MKAHRSLPEGYSKILHVNMQRDKKVALIINIGSGIPAAIMLAAGYRMRPGFQMNLPQLMLTVVGFLAYIILHELTHAAAMKAVGGGKVQFGFTGMYAYAGSNVDYLDKLSYRLIALAPVVVWGIVFLLLQLALPGEWFWVTWLWQIGNVAGAAGDIYITALLWNQPETILIRDTGVDVTVYDCKTQETVENAA